MEEEEYKFERETLYKQAAEEDSKYVKYLVTLSAGALALSLTFITKVADKPVGVDYLIIAWGLLIFSLCSIILSSLFSVTGCLRNVRKLDKSYEEEIEYKTSWFKNFVLPLNWISFITLVFGLLTLVVFVCKNLGG